jgi:uncharacterized membrane protein
MVGRKGFELAISTLVVMILGIIILAGGIVLLLKLTDKGFHTEDEFHDDQELALCLAASQGQLVAVCPSTQTLAAGTSATYTLIVENHLDKKTFGIQAKAQNSQGNPEPRITVSFIPTLDVEKNRQSRAKLTVHVEKTVPAGTYAVFVTVSQDAATYDSVRFFTVHVA